MIRTLEILALIIAISVAAFATYSDKYPLETRYSQAELDACVEAIFSDADAYDPSSHFTINSDSAFPNTRAVRWTRDALKDCLNPNQP